MPLILQNISTSIEVQPSEADLQAWVQAALENHTPNEVLVRITD